MLFRKDPDRTIAIGQPAHAWVSGQLARAWGNADFGTFAPWEEVCLAAEQHDIGMAEWEGNPTFNPQTRLPHSFMDLPEPLHMAMFSAASRLIAPQNRYAALLSSLHFRNLAERFGKRDTPENAAVIDHYLATEIAWQDATLRGLRDDPTYALCADDATVSRNRQLVSIWDWLSLLICMGLRTPQTVADVPAATGTATLTLTRRDSDLARVAVAPWPFNRPEVRLTVEGRQLNPPFLDESTMRAALSAAPWLTIHCTLTPA